jgi:two-component system cell cycle response regulator
MEIDSTVLIVDDQPSTRELLAELLAEQGYKLAFAGDGQEGLTQAADLIPDVILLDVMMPGMDGFEVCQRLRGDPLLAEVPVIMLTALNDRASRIYGIQAGADDFVSKPFDQLELQARVRTITQLNRYRRLHTERAKFEWVVENAEDGYLILDDDGLVLYANPQARHYLGLPASRSQSISETFLDLARKQYRCEPQEMWALWAEQASGPPLRLVRPESDAAGAFWLQVERMEMSPGSGDRYLIHLSDITAEVLTQRLTWTFHSQVSHKLRTSAAVLAASLQLLAADEPSLSEAQRTLFSSAYKGAQDLANEIQDIFRYLDTPLVARSGQWQCSLAEISCVAEEVKARLGLASVRVTQVDGEQSIDEIANQMHVPLSRRAVELILQELLENAQKFHPQRSPAVEIELSLVADSARIRVRDDGLTLSPEQLARLWIPYYQAEKHPTGQVAGMGLGLSTVASLVWDAGGTCQAYNREPGPGLTLEFALPVTRRDTRMREAEICSTPARFSS